MRVLVGLTVFVAAITAAQLPANIAHACDDTGVTIKEDAFGIAICIEVIGPGGGGTDTPVPCSWKPIYLGSGTSYEEGGYLVYFIDAQRYRVHLTTGDVSVWSRRSCPSGTSYNDWRPLSGPTLASLRQVVLHRIFAEANGRVPDPVPLISPTERGVVNVGLWLGIDESQTQVDPIRAEAASVWAEAWVTVEITRFEFTHPNAEKSLYPDIILNCTGHGEPIPDHKKLSADQAPNCGWTPDVKTREQPYTINITTTWQVHWQDSTGATGTHPDHITTTTTLNYHIDEIQTIGGPGN